MKQVYILLTRTRTMPARMIHVFTNGAFTHTSISLRPVTDEFYSYARRTLHNPLNAGLIVENIHTFVFAKYPDCHCAVYTISISDRSYQKLKELIQFYMRHYDRCRYNFAGMLPSRLGIRIPRKFRFTCSQFVAFLLYRSGAVSLPKDPYLMMPDDFMKICGAKKIYEGRLDACRLSREAQIPEFSH